MADTPTSVPSVPQQHPELNVYVKAQPQPKNLTILLSYHWVRVEQKLPPFQVKSISDTTLYKPADWLTVEIVHELCLSPQWAVTMVDFDYIAHLTGMLGMASSAGVKVGTAGLG